MKKRILSLAMAAASAVSMLAGGISASAETTIPHVAYIDPSVHIVWDGTDDIHAYYKYGDMNRDGGLSEADVAILQAYVTGTNLNPTLLVFSNDDPTFRLAGRRYTENNYIEVYGDVNFDGDINIMDVVALATRVETGDIANVPVYRCSFY